MRNKGQPAVNYPEKGCVLNRHLLMLVPELWGIFDLIVSFCRVKVNTSLSRPWTVNTHYCLSRKRFISSYGYYKTYLEYCIHTQVLFCVTVQVCTNGYCPCKAAKETLQSINIIIEVWSIEWVWWIGVVVVLFGVPEMNFKKLNYAPTINLLKPL